MNRLEKAKEEAGNVLSGLEDSSLAIGQAALKCLKIARLMNDEKTMLWLRYETSGYPSQMPNEVFEIAWEKGRGFYKDSAKKVFRQTAGELESFTASQQEALKCFSTAGTSVSGDMAVLAMSRLTETISRSASNYLNNIRTSQARLNILRSNYYDYALTVYNELQFAGQVEELFHHYRAEVDAHLTTTMPENLRRLQIIYDSLNTKDPESWAQAVLTCRRLITGLADELFKHPTDQAFKTKSGKELDVSGDNYKNRLFAIIDECGDSDTRARLTISSVEYIIGYINDLQELINKGIHEEDNPITYEEARMAVVHTYILLGDIILSIKLRD